MAITAARIEANGWVLRLTLTGSLSTVATVPDTAAQWTANFASYALAPNTAAPAMKVTGLASGFIQSGGTAVASAGVSRTLIATKVLRKPVVATPAGARNAKTPDEVDNGDGTITVRIALSQYVYATDTGLTLAVLAGWRTGEAAAAGIAVTNNSTVPAPAPIVRWADVPYQMQAGSFALEVVVAAFHPSGLAPVAGVKFTVTDGTTVKTYWATALSTSTKYSAGGTGQGLRVYSVTVDPTTAAPLTKGLLRCDFEVCPWIGPVQKSDVAGTRSMTGLGYASTSTSAFVPFVVAYNPVSTFTASISGTTMTVSGFAGYPLFVGAHITGAGVALPTVVTALGTGTGGNGTYSVTSQTVGSTAMQGQWLPVRYAYVNATTGAGALATNVSTSPAAAAATPLSTINNALQSFYLNAVTLAAANGQAAVTRSMDGCRIRLAAGVVAAGAGTTGVTFGANNPVTWIVVEGDPADSNPLVNCILRSPSATAAGNYANRIRATNLSIEVQSFACLAVPNGWLDGAEVRAVSGQEATTTPPFSYTNGLVWATNSKYWKHNSQLAYTVAMTTMLARNVSVERSVSGPLVANCARLPSAVSVAGMSLSTVLTDAGYALERIAVGNDMRYLVSVGMGGNSATLANASAPAALTLGTTYTVLARFAALNNVGEVYGAPFPVWSDAALQGPLASSEIIVEGNTLVGDRTNMIYNDITAPSVVTVEGTDSESAQSRLVRYANNVATWNPSKQDAYNGLASQTRIGVALATTRNKAFVVYNPATPGATMEIVVAGSPANVYHCTQAGTTAATGGPTGTGTGIVDGTARFDWVATESRQHGFRPQATGTWSAHYGVMFEGNVDLQSTADGNYNIEFQFEFYGLASNQLVWDGVSLTTDPFTLDRAGTSNRLNWQAAGTGGGDYKPLPTAAGAYILGRARSASVDVDQRGVARGAAFAAGAIEGPTAIALIPAAGREATRASTPTLGWAATLAAAGSRLATRAAAGLAGWSALLAPASARLAGQAASPAAGWTTLVVVAGGRSATAAAGTTVTWLTGVIPDAARSASTATASRVTGIGPWLVAIDGGRIAIVDQTLPILLPGSATPAERTLIVTGDFRTITIA